MARSTIIALLERRSIPPGCVAQRVAYNEYARPPLRALPDGRLGAPKPALIIERALSSNYRGPIGHANSDVATVDKRFSDYDLELL